MKPVKEMNDQQLTRALVGPRAKKLDLSRTRPQDRERIVTVYAAAMEAKYPKAGYDRCKAAIARMRAELEDQGIKPQPWITP